MGRLIDLEGKKFGRLYVVSFVGLNHRKEAVWRCKCDCGNEINVRSRPLRIGHTKSCGCLKIEEEKTRAEHPHKKTHGLSNSRLYTIWLNMKARCLNRKNEHYNDYGGRGITICQEWLDDFMNFYNWAIENGYSDDLSIDRINVNGNYEPSNCRWVCETTQANNKRNNKIVEYKGQKKTIHQLAKENNVNYSCLRWRIENGWDIDEALNKPSQRKIKR